MKRIRLPYGDLFKKIGLLFTLLMSMVLHSGAQLTFNNVSDQSSPTSHCYTLTSAAESQRGSVWGNTRIDLTQNFDISFSLNFGNISGWPGGDGMAFVLQPTNVSQIGFSGSAKGYGNTYLPDGSINIPGITPSVDIEYDTYDDNGGTIASAALLFNGDYRRTYANTGVNQLPIGFVNNGQYHTSRVTWDATTKTITLYFDGVQRFSYQKDFVTDIFANQNLVYFGFTAGTGGSFNQQSVCINTDLTTFTANINPPLPTPTISASGPLELCSNGSVVLTSSYFTGNTWSDGSTSRSITVTPETAGSYTVSVSQGSVVSTSAPTIVTALAPKPTISASGSLTFCEGGSVQLTASLGTSYLWNTGETTPSITATASGNYSVVVSNGNCQSSSDPVVVTVNPSPVTPSFFALDATEFCEGSSVTITVANVQAGVNYQWLQSLNGGYANPMPGKTGTSLLVTSAGRYTVMASNSCGMMASGTYQIFVNPKPTIDAVTGNNTVCSGNATTLTASSTASNSVFQWSEVINSGGPFGSNAKVVIGNDAVLNTPTLLSNASYEVMVTDGHGCSSDPQTVNVTVNPISTLTITPANPVICSGSSLILNSTITAGIGSSVALPIVSSLSAGGQSSAKLVVGLRKLVSTYEGPAIRLRRSYDDAESDFGFSGNELDLTAISTFLGGSDGFVTTLYDQSGNGGDVTQTNTINQPTFISNGLNGKPNLHMSSWQYMNNTVNYPSPFTVVYAARQTGPSRFRMLSSVSNNWFLGWWGTLKGIAYYDGWLTLTNGNVSSNNDNNSYVYTGSSDGINNSFIYQNGTLLATTASGFSGPDGISLNNSGIYGELSDGDYSEVYIFNTELSNSDRQLVENSAASYYSIYAPSGTVAGPSLTVNPTTTTPYTINANDANGCAVSNSITVTVTNIDDQSVTADPATICESGSSTVTVGGSQLGINYTLRNNADNTIVAGPIAGTGSAINFNTGTISTTTTYNVLAEKPSGQGSLSFNGNNSYVSVPHKDAYNMNSITLEAMVYFNGSTNIGNVILKGSYGWGMGITSGGTIEWWNQFSQNEGPNSTYGAVPVGQWTHIAVTVGNGQTKFYVNGVLNAVANEAIINNNNGALYFGTQGECLCNNFDGKIDEIRIWNTVRTQEEIDANKTACLSGTENGLVSLFKFNDATGTTTVDDMGVSNGIMNNFDSETAWSTSNPDITCASASCSLQLTDTPTVNVSSLPTATITASGSTDIVLGSSVTLTASEGSSYEWSNGETSQAITTSVAGSYTVSVTNETGCTSSSIPTTVTTYGVAPEITVPVDITVNNDPGECGAIVNLNATETIGVPASTITYSPASGSLFPIGTTTVTATATNLVGTSIKTFNVTVIDNEKPAFSISPTGTVTISIPYLETPNSSSAAVGYNFANSVPQGAVITGIDLAYSAKDQGWGYTGGYTRFYLNGNFIGGNQINGHTVFSLNINYAGSIPGYNYANGANNTFEFGFEGYPGWQGFFYGGTMTIHYSTNDFVFGPITVNNVSGTCGATVVLVAPPTSDNCDVASVTNDAPETFPVGTTDVTWIATDTHGNTNTITQTVTVVDNQPPVVTTKNITVQLSNGSATITAADINNGSTDNCGIDSYSLDKTSFNCNNVGTNTVTLTVTDIHGNSASATANVMVTSGGTQATITAGGPTTFCSGGSVTLTASAGTGYLWSTGETTPSITVSTSGSYTVTVSGSSICTTTSAPMVVTVNSLPIVNINAGGPTTICEGGSVSLSSSAARNALQFNGANYTESINSALPMGNSSRTIEAWIKTTMSGNGAIVNWGNTTTTHRFGILVISGKLYFVGENADLIGTITINDGLWHHVAVTYDGTTISSYVDGVADATAAISLNTVNTTLRIGQRSVGDNGNELFVGTIDEVRIWNIAKTQSQLQATKNLGVAANSAGLVAYYQMDEASGSITTDASTNNVAATLISSPARVASGAPINYSTYLWSNTATTPAITVNTTGSYNVTVSNAGGCSVTSSPITVTVNPVTPATISATGPTTLCPGATVRLKALASEATTYTWKKWDGSQYVDAGSTAYFIDVSVAGQYYVTMTDVAGCTTNSNVTDIYPPNPIVLSITAQGANSCNAPNNGSASVTSLTGGNAPYTVSWTGPNGFSSSYYSINNLAAGTYTVTGKDACGTTVSTNVTIVQPDSQPQFMAVSGSTTLCNPESTVSIAAYQGASSYVWQRIVNGVTIPVSGSGYYIDANQPGAYYVSMTDAYGCLQNSNIVNVYPPNPIPLTATTNLYNPYCSQYQKGTVDFLYSGGTAPLTFNGWSDGNNIISTNTFVSNLEPGTYTASATDACGVTVTKTVTIVTAPAMTLPTITASAPFCGSNAVTLTLGATGYNFDWFKYDDVHQQGYPAFAHNQSSIVVSDPGFYYTVSLVDTNGCYGYPNGFSTTAPLPLSINVVGNPSCGGPSFGSAYVNQLNGGKYPITYAWTDGSSFTSSNSNINNIPPGTYTVTVTDACANAVSQSVTITGQVTSATITSTSQNVCAGSSAVLSITNYNASYSYQWVRDGINIPGATGSTYTANVQGSYNVNVTNGICGNGSNGIFILIGSPLTIDIFSNATSCVNGGGYASVLPQGGVGPFTFLGWTGPNGYTSGSTNINSLTVGTYTATYLDFCGTQVSASVTINPGTPVILPSITASKPYCSAGDSVVLTLGPTAYSFAWVEYDPSNLTQQFNWAFSPNQSSITVTKPGVQYYVVHTDANNCNSFSQGTYYSTSLPTPITFSVTSNPSCGTNTGAANVFNILGGKSPVTYAWTNGASFNSTNGFIGNLAPGIYTITLTDACANVVSQSVTITGGISAATLTSTSQNICSGSSALLSITNYNASYTYQWIKDGIDISGATGTSYSASAQGNYSVKVSNGVCTTYSSGIFISVASSLAFTINATPSCGGTTNGFASVQTNGGKFPATYSWTNSGGTVISTSSFLNSLSAGTYTCTITDACGTQVSHSFTIAQLPAVTGSLTGVQGICTVGGSTTLVANTNGTPVSYNWGIVNNNIFTSVATTQSFSTTTPGNYSVSIKDANGCNTFMNATITALGTPFVLTVTSNNSCGGTNFGSVNATFSGTLPITGAWTDGGSFSSTNPSVNNLPAGVYTATATDGCGTTISKSVTIYGQVTAPTITTSATNICFGTSAQLTITNVDPLLSYQWKLNGVDIVGQTGTTLTATLSGTYQVLASNGACSSISNSFFITVQPAQVSPFDITINSTNSCGTNNGSAFITRSGGTAPYTFLGWTGSNGYTNNSTSITNLAPGIYTATYKDLCGTTVIKSMVITHPAANTVTINEICGAGSTIDTLKAFTNGQALNYAWSKYDYTQAKYVSIGSLQSLPVTDTGLYSVTIKDTSTCFAGNGLVIINRASPSTVFNVSISTSNICAGGSAFVSLSGTQKGYWYILYKDGVATATKTQSSNGLSISFGVSAVGSYTIVASTAATGGCTLAMNGVVQVLSINNPLPVVAPITPVTGSVCVGSTIQFMDVTAGGVWLTQSSTVATSDSNGLYTGNAPGNILIAYRVTDALGCFKQVTDSLYVNPLPATPVITANGSLTLSTGQTVTLTSSAATSNLWSNGATTQSIVVGTADVGTYTVTVSSNTCSATSSPTIVSISDVAPVITVPADITVNNDPGVCGAIVNFTATETTGVPASKIIYSHASGSLFPVGTTTVTATATNSAGSSIKTFKVIVTDNEKPVVITKNITVQLSNGSATITEADINNGSTDNCGIASYSLDKTSFNCSNVGTNTVTLTITDFQGNSASATANVIVNGGGSPATITASGPTTFCSGSSVTLTASAGASYLWSDGSTTPSITVNQPGDYSVTVTNASGCSSVSAKTTVAVYSNLLPTISASGPTTFCSGGSVTLTASAGSSYKWSNGSTSSSITVNQTGDYSVTVTNANGCSSLSNMTTVTVNPSVTATVTADGPTTFCAGGSVKLTSSSATGNVWSSGEKTPSIVVTTSGNYSVIVTNGSGCSATSTPVSVTVNQPTPATITASGPTTFCSGGSVTLTSAGVKGNAWSNGAYSASISVNSTGNYSVTITDANGCVSTSATTAVTVNPTPVATITASGPTTFCAGGSVILTSSANSGNTWSNNAGNSNSITVTQSGNYSVTVSNGNGCSATSAPVSVTVNANPVVTISANGATDFCPGSVVMLTSSISTGNNWSNGATTASITVSQSNSYSVSNTNANGCTATSNTISVNASDKIAPVPDVPSLAALSILPGDVIVPPSATDNCSSGKIIATTGDPIVGLTPGTYTINWTYTDNNNNSTSQQQTITVRDNTPPTLRTMPAIVKNNDLGECGAIVTYTLPVAKDNVSTNTISVTEGGGDGTITFDTKLSSNVTGIDFVAANEFQDIIHGHGANLNVRVEVFNPIDNSWTLIKTIQTGIVDYHLGGTSINFPTTITQVSKIRFVADRNVGAAFHLYDLAINLSSISLVQRGGLPSGSKFPVGVTINKFDAIDVAGNVASASFTVTILDRELPVLTGFAASTHNAAGNCAWTGSASTITVSDNCPNPLLLTEQYFDQYGNRFYNGQSTVAQGSITLANRNFPTGVNTAILTVTDVAGNVSQVATFNITVLDVTPPTIVASGDITQKTDPGGCGAFVTVPVPRVTDNCTIKSVVNSFNGGPGASGKYPTGKTVVTWTVTDVSGNQATTSQTITIVDKEKPAIYNVPRNIIQTNDAGSCGAKVIWDPVRASDNCGLASFVADHNPGEVFPLGVTTVNFTAIDKNGNDSTTSFTITVTDNEAPRVISKPVTVTLVNGAASITPAAINNGSYDNCGAVTLSASKVNFTCADVGVNQVTLNVTDAYNNTSSAIVLVTVIGQVPTSNIVVTPNSNLYTGGVATNLYLGYGPTGVSIKDSVTGVTPITYSWTGSTGLSCTNCAVPSFTPSLSGYSTFYVTATNKYGCTTQNNVSICVRDIRVPNGGGNVFVCHTDPNSPTKTTLSVAIGQVDNQLAKNPDDKLGSCDMAACNVAAAASISSFNAASTKEDIVEQIAGLTAKASPNPTNHVFRIVASSPRTTPVQIRLLSEAGKVQESRSNVAIGSIVEMGENLQSGVYFAEVIQGNERVVLKLIKLNR